MRVRALLADPNPRRAMRSSSILPIICLRDGLRFLRTSALSLRCHSTSFVVVLALLAPHPFCTSGEGDGEGEGDGDGDGEG